MPFVRTLPGSLNQSILNMQGAPFSPLCLERRWLVVYFRPARSFYPIFFPSEKRPNVLVFFLVFSTSSCSSFIIFYDCFLSAVEPCFGLLNLVAVFAVLISDQSPVTVFSPIVSDIDSTFSALTSPLRTIDTSAPVSMVIAAGFS